MLDEQPHNVINNLLLTTRLLESSPVGVETVMTFSEPSQIYTTVILAKIVNGFQLLTIFPKTSILDV